MTITERAALEGLRMRCIDELAKGNRRMATEEEVAEILCKVEGRGWLASIGQATKRELGIKPIFRCLAAWLTLVLDAFVSWEDNVRFNSIYDFVIEVAIDILNKEEEDGRAKAP